MLLRGYHSIGDFTCECKQSSRAARDNFSSASGAGVYGRVNTEVGPCSPAVALHFPLFGCFYRLRVMRFLLHAPFSVVLDYCE